MCSMDPTRPPPADLALQRGRQGGQSANEAQAHATGCHVSSFRRKGGIDQRQQGIHLSSRAPPVLRGKSLVVAVVGG